VGGITKVEIGETLITLFTLGSIFYIIYTKVKNQTLKDTADEVKELVTSKPIE